ncbi:MAG: flagellar brake protein [Candidatus Electrothrix sp. ATG1]|nr:flagellar brake protein [Candidatus Electrothrix sp. ATG1]
MPDTTCNDRMNIEIGMRLTVKLCRINESVTCELVGMRYGRYLILRKLEGDFPVDPLRKEEELVVKFLCAGNPFSFSSRFIQCINSPDKLFFIECRETAQDCDERSRERFDCFVCVRLTSGETVFNANVVNISTQGCRCEFDNLFDIPLDIDARISICFAIGKPVVGKVRVIRRQFLSKYQVGISFEKLDGDNQRTLTELIPLLRF